MNLSGFIIAGVLCGCGVASPTDGAPAVDAAGARPDATDAAASQDAAPAAADAIAVADVPAAPDAAEDVATVLEDAPAQPEDTAAELPDPAADAAAGKETEADCPEVVTYATVQPVFKQYCGKCHGWGTACKVAKQHGKQIVQELGVGMPPDDWPQPSVAAQNLIHAWVKAGMPCSAPECL